MTVTRSVLGSSSCSELTDLRSCLLGMSATQWRSSVRYWDTRTCSHL